MRGGDEQTGELFSYVNLEKRVRSDHPLRSIRGLVNDALVALEQEFAALYAPIGRPSIPPEKLLRAMLLQAFYSIRSERQLMERLEFDLLFRWFVGIGVDDAAWDHSVFSKNRERLLEGDIAAKLLSAVLAHPRVRRLLSTFFGRRHVDRSLGVDEELQAEGNRPRTETDGTGRWIFTARSARTTPTPRLPIQRRGSIAKGLAKRPSSASWGMP
jgi:transposase